MARSRTIGTLVALLVAMILGAMILMALERSPLAPVSRPMAAVADQNALPCQAVYLTDVRFQPLKWRNIVIHSGGGESGDVAAGCHFLVTAGRQSGAVRVLATPLWRRQREGQHIELPGHDLNAISVGICVEGEFTATPPLQRQVVELVRLVRTLQDEFGIPADRVYRHSDLVPGSRSPGRLFPDIDRYLVRPGQ